MAHNPVNHYSPPEAKIALFRSLFRGREDVYFRRFESRRTLCPLLTAADRQRPRTIKL